ncbi:MAG TPA: glutamine--fructose-6-phosphate transaminase (isomerizing) [Candidatus Kapabacteria bacterium]|nr:glutamine--fructose-6-phosphate transaminase (isomerizing) [Candidatus Kapabacteria bacterium]
MCGIVGYVGNRSARPIILAGLKRLEYRGYDSAGVATIETLSSDGKSHSVADGDQVVIYKRKGKVTDLEEILKSSISTATIGIGHTRWATHGAPNDVNAHPHTDQSGNIALLHNGIIENYTALKKTLLARGHTFKSETDTEVLAHLIGEFYSNGTSITEAVRLALNEVVGAYGICVIAKDSPREIVCARKGSPIVIGIGDNENFIASDATAIVAHTRNVIYLSDGEMATITENSVKTRTIGDVEVTKAVEEITIKLEELEKGGYEHFMLKEIHEQSDTVHDAMRGRVIADEGTTILGGLRNHWDRLRNARRIIISACGTSYHAGVIGKYMIEQLAQIPVDIEYASEFRYRNPVVNKDDIMIVVSQSGETADTLAAMKEGKRKGATVLGLVNVVGSTIARESDGGVYIHAGPEIGVASTKAFTSQVTVFALLSIMLGRMKSLSVVDGKEYIRALTELPTQIEALLTSCETQVKTIVSEFSNAAHFLYLGRGYNYPVALEGALKLKEISYIHAEGYPAAEMKHGPIALIDENMPVVVVAPKDDVYEKVVSNIQEVRARSGRIIAIASDGDKDITELADYVIYIPNTLPMLVPILSVIPLQLLSYYMATARGANVDQPRNLAKSVTVE